MPVPAYRYEETENTKRIVPFDADDRAVVVVVVPRPLPPSPFLSLRLSRRERRTEARRGSGRRRMGAQRVDVWRRSSPLDVFGDYVQLYRHLFHGDGLGYVALYLPSGVKPTAEDEHALMVVTGYRRPSREDEERERERLRAEAEHARAMAFLEAERNVKPNLPAWW